MFTRAPSLLATALVLGVTLAGCSSNPEPIVEKTNPAPSPSEAPEGRLLTPAEAKAALPAVSELSGDGWTAGETPLDESDPTVEPASCKPLYVQFPTDFAGYRPKLAAKESVTFSNESSNTQTVYEVSSWTQAPDAGLPLAAGALVDRCPSFTVTDADGTDDMTATKLKPLAIGEKRIAVQLTSQEQGTTIYLTVFEAVVGHNLIAVAQGGTEPGDPQQSFAPLIQHMLRRLGTT
ncbi:hypothetical protein [Cryptosporangium phraense]|uniref:DUF5642 domain-containing protein n=1 Tax=Cryptosporangium phraense TaxID=2593070 RepID=A0A545ALR4_9ACTN|nr:hypothetical protein [Cryptosporangium phraense]TQS42263.1 hypothetical protein FL583_25345 [Cryptosporangium phraense]